MHGEQGAESIHAEMNKLSLSAKGIKSQSDRLMCVMKKHHTKVMPKVQHHVIPQKSRKRKYSE